MDADDSEFIHKGCLNMMPGLEKCKILKESVGLRPGRNAIRLERDEYRTSMIYSCIYVWLFGKLNCISMRFLETGKILQIVHNYGHGGSGVTLSWGCAEEVYLIVKDILREVDLKCKL